MSATAPAVVGEPLAQALGALLCRGLRHRGAAGRCCPECMEAGRALAPAVGEALFTCRRRGRAPLSAKDYQAIGQALEQLELAAP